MVLNRRRLYMLPTGHGVLFSLVLLAIFLASVNYNNGLAYGLSFLLVSIAFVSMLHTHRNVSGLDVQVLSCAPVFAGATAHFRISVRNPLDFARVSIWILCGEYSHVFHTGPLAISQLEVPVTTTQRGYITCPPIRLASTYPLGLQYTWSTAINSAVRGVVYPKPAGNAPLPRSQTPAYFSEASHNLEGDDFAGLREYVVGDPPRHVHWKAVASHRELLTKQFSGGGVEQQWLRWEDTSGSTETRLSQLTQWIVDAERSSLRYGLSMPNQKIPPGRGQEHYHRCLRLLGLWGLEDGAAQSSI